MTSPSQAPVADLLAVAVAAVGGSHRLGQVQMAEAVADAIAERRHLLVQAGTGTGKSLAYLVPGIAHALESHEPVIVATATLALQAQLVDRDLPVLVDSLEPLLHRKPTFAILKGRHHYLCRHKLDHGSADEAEGLFSTGAVSPTTDLERQITRVREWAEDTTTGDRDELDPGVDNRVWNAVSVSSRECLGASRCPMAADCFAEQARERAMEADVVVTNHAMLAIDALENVQILPEHDVVIVDEGHELADRVTGAATGELAPSAADRAARRAHRYATAEVAESFQQAGLDLAAVLAGMDGGRLDVLREDLALALAVLRDSARSLVADLGEDDGGGAGAGGAEPDGDAARRQARAGIEEVLEVAERLLAESDADVSWLEITDRRGPVLYVAPLDVAPLLRTGLFGGRTVVLTSATLQLGGSFDAVARSVGLFAGETPADWQGIDVGSPFDYPRQGILYVARHLPAPGRDGPLEAALDELADLVTAAGGRTLGLFSSRRAAEAAAEAVRDRVDFPVLCQGDDTIALLVKRFRAEERTCLFGTLSLWQGVDVPGPTCQLVVIDRIPFPRPDDPLASARQRAVERAGGNGFMSVAATQAALKLAQGAGRLIRSQGDRGVVAVLDSRLATARYAGFLRASLPTLWWTTDPAVVRKSLAAIDQAAVEAALGDPVSS